MAEHFLHKLLCPASIAIVGASTRQDSPGYRLVNNIVEGGYGGTLWLVNRRHPKMFGLTGYKSIRALPATPDLAIILTPENTLEKMISNCAEQGIGVAIIMTVTKIRKSLLEHARRVGVRILGPGCAGIIRPALSLNATYTENRISSGKIAVVSHSAALVSAVIDWADSNNIGFSALVATGIETDVTAADVIDYLADDYSTRAIILYVDRVRHSREFLSAISAAARNKPVLVLKSTQDSARFCDAVTRTGEIYSSDRVFEAALKRAGVVRIRTFSNLFAAARTLSSGTRLRGKKLAVVSNGAALSMLACDRIQAKGFVLSHLSENLKKQIEPLVKGTWSGVNPVVLRNYNSMVASYAAVVKLLLESEEYDGVMALYAPDPRCDALTIAEDVTVVANESHKPLTVCWMGDTQVLSSRALFQLKDVLSFRTPEAATDAFDFMYRYHHSQQLLLQLPDPVFDETNTDWPGARKIAHDALASNSRVLPAASARKLLRKINIPVVEFRHATTLADAIKYAAVIGYPVALKIVSKEIRYRSEVKGLILNIQTEEALIHAFNTLKIDLTRYRPGAAFEGVLIERMREKQDMRKLAIRIFRDPTFGPCISVGIGGDLQSLIYTRPVQLPPLNQFLIDDMLSDEHLAKYLGVFRNQPPASLEALAAILHQVSGMVCEIPEIYEMDINPLALDEHNAEALEVQIVVQKNRSAQTGYRHLAIHPYPRDWIRHTTLKNGNQIEIRPIRPEDGEGIADMVHNMSPESRYMRFMHAVDTLPPKMIAQFTKIDYDRQMAFCAVPVSSPETILGVSRYSINPDGSSSEFAIAIADEWQGLGLSKHLLGTLIEHAKSHNLTSVSGDVLRINQSMRGLMESMGFQCILKPEEPDQILCTLNLEPDPAA